MSKKIADFLKGEIVSSVFYILFGLCLVVFTEQTVNIICKVVFGLVLIGSGIYHVYIYAGEKENSTILDLFTGVIVLVLGGFLFITPQIIIRLLPYLLGALVLVDSIWTLKGAWRLKKLGNTCWKALLIGSGVFVGLGIFIIVYPFTKVTSTVIFAGCVMLADGISDIVFLILLRKGIKKGVIVKNEKVSGNEGENSSNAEATSEKAAQDKAADRKADVQEASADVVVWKKNTAKAKEAVQPESSEVDEGEDEDTLENEVIINGRWKIVAEEPVITSEEMGTETPESSEEVSGEDGKSGEETLEEWKD